MANKNTIWIVIAAIVLGIIVFKPDLIGMGGDDSIDIPKDDSGSGVLLTSDTSPSVTWNCVNKHDQSSAVTCDVGYFKVNGGKVQTDTDATHSFSCGDHVEYLINASGYYKVHGELDVPCVATVDVPIKLLQYDNDPTIKVVNEDDGLLNDQTNTEALPANAVDTQEVKYTPAYRKGIQDAAFYVDLAGTNIDKVTSSLGSDIGKPKMLVHNSTGTTRDETYVFPIGNVEDSQTEEWTFTIDVSGTTYSTADMIVGFIDKEWYVDASGNFAYGYEDEDFDDVGQTDAFPTWFETAAS